MSCASSRHITKLKQSIFAPFDIYGFTLATVDTIFKSLGVRFAFVWVGKNIMGDVDCSYAKSHQIECHYAECHYIESHYSDCHYTGLICEY
jgi:hypothetical protein